MHFFVGVSEFVVEPGRTSQACMIFQRRPSVGRRTDTVHGYHAQTPLIVHRHVQLLQCGAHYLSGEDEYPMTPDMWRADLAGAKRIVRTVEHHWF